MKIQSSNIARAPIITVDGGAATGKGSVASALAKRLDFNYLDSGVFYRALAFVVINQKLDYQDVNILEELALSLKLEFDNNNIFCLLDNQKVNITTEIRTEECSAMSSKISHPPRVRSALLINQRNLAKVPGLVAEGRDMGTVVFPQASVKFFLQCDAKIRAQRRQKQLENQGVYVNIEEVLQALQIRDERDKNRPVSPLKPAESAIIINTSLISLNEVIEMCVSKSLAGISQIPQS